MAGNRSKIEEAKALRAIKGVTASDADFETVAKALFSTPDPARERALEGLTQEDEFAILCRVMGTATHLARIDQSPLLEEAERIVPPDFLASFNPGCSVLARNRKEVNATYSCFVEVKSVGRAKFKISEKDLTRREAFAHHFKLPLIFAVRFKQFKGVAWVLVTTRQLRKLKRILDPTNLLVGAGYALLDDYMLAVPNAFDAAYTWDTAVSDGYVRDEERGALVGISISKSGITFGETARPFVAAILDAFASRVVSTTQAGEKTVQTLRISANQARSLSFIVQNCNQLPTDEASGKSAYDATRITSSYDAATPHMPLVTRDHVEYFVDRYFLNRTLFKLGVGKPDDQLTLLKQLSSSPLKT